MRRAIAGLFACVVSVAAAATLFAQEPVGNLHDLIGVRGRHGDNQMRERGYSFVRTVEKGANEFSYWRESRSGKCVSVRSAKNRYAAFSYVPDAECGGGSAQVGYGSGTSANSDNLGVTLHRGVNFTGVSQKFKSDMPNLQGSRIGDDQAASVSVSQGCRARLYQQPNYQGAYVEVTNGIGDLRGWNAGADSITSLRVRCDGGVWSNYQTDEASTGASSDSSGVTLHRGLNFTGVSENFKSDMPNLRGSRIGDDQAASVTVSQGCRARLFQQPNYQGSYVEVTSGIGDLRGWNAGVSSVTSLRVRCDGVAWTNDGDDGWSDTGSGDSENRGVTLHRDLKFAGLSEAFTSDVPDLRGSRIGDDHATSVTVSGGCRARLYQHLNYQGAYTEVTSSMTDLRGSTVGDDSATSLQVRCDGWGWSDDRADDWGAGASSVSRGVTLHRDLNYTGVSEAFASDVPDLRGSRVGDDQATSVSVSRGCQARLYQHLNYQGAYTEVTSSMDALRGSKVGDDSVTSIKVRCNTLTRSKTASGG